jgi:hypothetical protein
MKTDAEQVIAGRIRPEDPLLEDERRASERPERGQVAREGRRAGFDPVGAADRAEVVELELSLERARPERGAAEEERRGSEPRQRNRRHAAQDTAAGGRGRRRTPARALRAAIVALTFLAAADPAPIAAGECSCEEIREYLKTVEKKLDCYKKASAKAKDAILFTQKDTIPFMESCMGWTSGSAVSEGKPESAPLEERNAAQGKCKQNHCDWICEASIERVHEKAHSYFDRNHRMHVLVLLGHGLLLAPTAMERENIDGEIFAHQAEATFLYAQLGELERNGKCANPVKSGDQGEKDRRNKEAEEWLEKYLESLEKALEDLRK